MKFEVKSLPGLRLLIISFIFIVSCKKESFQRIPTNTNSNQPPIANAGADQTITLPANSVTLDGSGSSDPDYNVKSYTWTKISGPSTFNISNANAVQTQVTSLAQGVYLFELKVTDAGGFFSKDTVQITVTPESVCDNSNRPIITARLIPVGTLSKPRRGMAVASAGTKIFFAGGATDNDPEYLGSRRVDIYDVSNNSWSTAELSEGRWSIGSVSLGNKIFFAGGQYGDGSGSPGEIYYANVDIYDASTNKWTVAHLSEPRSYVTAGAVGNKVMFAGGHKNSNYDCTNRVDVYDISTNAWTTNMLSEPKSYISAVTVNNKLYLAGGDIDGKANPSSKIDIYDNATNTWSMSNLSGPMRLVAGATLADKIYWAAGCTVEIKNVTSGGSSIAYPYKGMQWEAHVVVKDNYILLFALRGSMNAYTWEPKFDIYNTTTNTWSIGLLPSSITSAISVNNIVYATDGFKVYKIEF